MFTKNTKIQFIFLLSVFNHYRINRTLYCADSFYNSLRYNLCFILPVTWESLLIFRWILLIVCVYLLMICVHNVWCTVTLNLVERFILHSSITGFRKKDFLDQFSTIIWKVSYFMNDMRFSYMWLRTYLIPQVSLDLLLNNWLRFIK